MNFDSASSDDDLDFGVHIEELLDTSAAKHKMAVRPKRNYTRRTSPSRYTWVYADLAGLVFASGYCNFTE